MIIANKKNESQLIALAPSIKNYMNEWQIINVNILKNSTFSQDEIMQRFIQQYRSFEGVIYPISETKIVIIIRLGILENYAIMKSEIEGKLPHHCCRILLKKMNSTGLKQIQIDLTKKDAAVDFAEDLFGERINRKENIVLVADDDSFIRKSLKIPLMPFDKICEVESGKEVVAEYIKHNPDILLLDIHMPDKTGLELIPEVFEIDSDAFIIILSADSNKDNVIKALELGAAGFLTKPPAKDKIQTYINQCMTANI